MGPALSGRRLEIVEQLQATVIAAIYRAGDSLDEPLVHLRAPTAAGWPEGFTGQDLVDQVLAELANAIRNYSR